MLRKIMKSILKENFSRRHHKPHYSSSDHYSKYRKPIHPSHYGHGHYKKKHRSGSFFSSFFSS
ncbi:hypothetical protein B6A27_07525 [Anoxybacillus sp. UARK-01]|nr:hypothetical protein B6A27_07525 [Anoxybacillus sp. UARK-01]